MSGKPDDSAPHIRIASADEPEPTRIGPALDVELGFAPLDADTTETAPPAVRGSSSHRRRTKRQHAGAVVNRLRPTAGNVADDPIPPTVLTDDDGPDTDFSRPEGSLPSVLVESGLFTAMEAESLQPQSGDTDTDHRRDQTLVSKIEVARARQAQFEARLEREQADAHAGPFDERRRVPTGEAPFDEGGGHSGALVRRGGRGGARRGALRSAAEGTRNEPQGGAHTNVQVRSQSLHRRGIAPTPSVGPRSGLTPVSRPSTRPGPRTNVSQSDSTEPGRDDRRGPRSGLIARPRQRSGAERPPIRRPVTGPAQALERAQRVETDPASRGRKEGGRRNDPLSGVQREPTGPGRSNLTHQRPTERIPALQSRPKRRENAQSALTSEVSGYPVRPQSRITAEVPAVPSRTERTETVVRSVLPEQDQVDPRSRTLIMPEMGAAPRSQPAVPGPAPRERTETVVPRPHHVGQRRTPAPPGPVPRERTETVVPRRGERPLQQRAEPESEPPPTPDPGIGLIDAPAAAATWEPPAASRRQRNSSAQIQAPEVPPKRTGRSNSGPLRWGALIAGLLLFEAAALPTAAGPPWSLLADPGQVTFVALTFLLMVLVVQLVPIRARSRAAAAVVVGVLMAGFSTVLASGAVKAGVFDGQPALAVIFTGAPAPRLLLLLSTFMLTFALLWRQVGAPSPGGVVLYSVGLILVLFSYLGLQLLWGGGDPLVATLAEAATSAPFLGDRLAAWLGFVPLALALGSLVTLLKKPGVVAGTPFAVGLWVALLIPLLALAMFVAKSDAWQDVLEPIKIVSFVAVPLIYLPCALASLLAVRR